MMMEQPDITVQTYQNIMTKPHRFRFQTTSLYKRVKSYLSHKNILLSAFVNVLYFFHSLNLARIPKTSLLSDMWDIFTRRLCPPCYIKKPTSSDI